MFKLLFILPLLVLVLAVTLGWMPSKRWGLVTLGGFWFAAATVLSNWSYGDHVLILFAGFVLACLGPIAAVTVGIWLGRNVTPAPVDVVYEIYKDLDPETKRRMKKAARQAAKSGLRASGKYFRDNGDALAGVCDTARKTL